MKTKQKTINRSKQITSDLTSQLKEAMKKENESWIEFCILAYEAYYTEEWRRKGYSNPKDYVQRELEGQISYEVFMHRVKMGEAIRKFNIPRSSIADLGWSKFKEVASLILFDEKMTRDDAVTLIKECEGRSHREIQDFVRKERTKIMGEQSTTIVNLKFRLVDEQDAVVKEALSIACELAETDNMSIALVYIATEFITSHAPADSEVAKAIRAQVKQTQKEVKKKHKPHAHKKKELIL